MSLKSLVDVAASVAMIVAAGVIVYVNLGRAPAKREFVLPKEPVTVTGSAFLGNPGSAVVAVIYSDFHCPFCKRFGEEILPALRTDYVTSGKIGLVFKHLPIETLHPHAFRAAVVAECAKRAGAFWEMHDVLFAAPREYSDEPVKALAALARVDPDSLMSCLKTPPDDAVREDMAEAKKLGITSTPFTLIGRRAADGRINVVASVAGVKALGEFKRALDSVLAR